MGGGVAKEDRNFVLRAPLFKRKDTISGEGLVSLEALIASKYYNKCTV